MPKANPDRVQEGLNHGDEHGFERRDVAHGPCIQDVGDAELHHTEQDKVDHDRWLGCEGRDEGDADKRSEDVAEEDTLHVRCASLRTHEERYTCKRNSTGDGNRVANDRAALKRVEEEHAHAKHHSTHGDDVDPRDALARNKPTEQTYPHRCGVLEEDGVRSRRELGGRDEEDDGECVGDDAADLRARPCGRNTTVPCEDDERSNGTACAGNRECIKRYALDEEATSAPQDGTQREREKCPRVQRCGLLLTHRRNCALRDDATIMSMRALPCDMLTV